MHISTNCFFANSANTAAHELSAAREPIGVAEKRQQHFNICDYRCIYLF